jgi:hypothetical protein
MATLGVRDRSRLAAAGPGQAVAVIGKPGMGKSRLALEFRQARHPVGIRCSGGCASYGAAVTCLPLVDLIGRAWRI